MRTLFALLCVSFAVPTPTIAEQYGDPQKLRDFVGREEVLTNILAIETASLTSHQIPKRPWSGSYWPDISGSVAAPYRAPGYLDIPVSWAIHRSFMTRQLRALESGELRDDEINYLSPATKYDLVIGDPAFTFTKQMIARVNHLYDDSQTELWTGICHGWAPASLVLDPPQYSFTIPAVDGREVTFYPDDIKALASILWADSFAQDYVKIEGWQCRSGAKTDENFRLLDPKCFDVNPAFFHLVMVNQIGLNNRGVIIDRRYKKPVKNDPYFAYSYQYFNPKSKKSGGTFNESAVLLGGSFRDPYKKYRSPLATKVVGIELKAWYVIESWFSKEEETYTPNADEVTSIKFRYDLELDHNGEILGGEWYKYKDPKRPNMVEALQYEHPDIIWLVPENLTAWSVGDYDLAGLEWDPRGTMAETDRQKLVSAAIKAANTIYRINETKQKPHPQPLGRVVYRLLELSRSAGR